ncbi:MAG: Coenzyme F420 hydrogenase/dehydrogenase, beta subunit C-terminal domain [Candidatus Hydrothermarchaeales archaeon]
MELAYVGLPCQIEGLRKVAAVSRDIGQDWMEKVTLQIGLFCRENWSYSCFRALLQDDYGVDLEKVKKFDIKKGNIIAYLSNGDKVEFPLKESKPYVRISCLVCLDFTAELADISVGAVGTPKKWSTVITRTKKGEELLQGAEREGYIETQDIQEVKPGTNLIKKISKQKLDGALAEVQKREEIGVNVPHLHSMDSEIEGLKKGEKKVFNDLNYEIIDNGLCSACGICEAVCPVDAIKVVDERPELVAKCDGYGFCYFACPRNHLPIKALKKRVLNGEVSSEEGLGEFLSIKAVRAKDEKILNRGQDGGAVTALLAYALDKGIISGAISVKAGADPWRPEPCLSTTREELLKSSGTFYAYSTTIPAVKP